MAKKNIVGHSFYNVEKNIHKILNHRKTKLEWKLANYVLIDFFST